jgi:hypothetical protein
MVKLPNYKFNEGLEIKILLKYLSLPFCILQLYATLGI